MEQANALTDEEEQALRLSSIGTLLPELQGPGAIDLLIDILASDNEDARDHVGFSLIEAAQERPGDVQKGIERALKRLPSGSPALSTLPYVMLGFGDYDVVAAMPLFLTHTDADAVAAAIEVCVELEDERAIAWLEPLAKDSRTVETQDEQTGDVATITIGELASDAIREIKQVSKMFASADTN